MEKYFVYYEGFDWAMDFLTTDSDKLRFLRETIDYGLHGIEPESPINAMAFALVKQKIDAQKARSKQAKINGSKGGRPKKTDGPVSNAQWVSQSSQIVNAEPEGEFLRGIK